MLPPRGREQRRGEQILGLGVAWAGLGRAWMGLTQHRCCASLVSEKERETFVSQVRAQA